MRLAEGLKEDLAEIGRGRRVDERLGSCDEPFDADFESILQPDIWRIQGEIVSM